MSKTIFALAVAGLLTASALPGVAVAAPAHKAANVATDAGTSIDLSARRFHRGYRHYRHYGGYYRRPYYRPYPYYAYAPQPYYNPYYRPYYRPAPFGFFPF